MRTKFQRTTKKDLMLLQLYPLSLWPLLGPGQFCGCHYASWGEHQLSPPWEEHVTPGRRNAETKEQKEHQTFFFNIACINLTNGIISKNEKI